ncbi:MAG TPA: phosphomevalonate kinase [Myxococcales bacterium]|nr:phosphomevalonate kinase [Myxococcales bacterium]
MERALSAPGKLFLAGEYAVLWGGQAQVAAVGPRAGALVRRREDREVHLLTEAGRCSGHLTPLGINFGGKVPAEFAFAARAASEVVRAHGREAVGFDLALGGSPRAPDGRKLGMGGSARACVLASEATRFVLEERLDPLKLALLAHALAQGGKGSGADVAAIYAGGVVRYRRYDVGPLAEASAQGRLESALSASPPVEVWRFPPLSAALSYVFTGASASTPELISKVEAKVKGAARERFVADSDELGAQLEAGLVERDFRAVREAVAALQRLLETLPVPEAEPVRRIVALASSFGSAAKISGAGGGDGCIVFSEDDQARAALLEALAARGLYALPLAVEPGLKGEPAADPALVAWLR